VALICFFALLTRFEPSVLRASAMAVVACTAFGLGRPASRGRILCLAVTAVLLLDPFLVRSVGFLLSVGACAGIVSLARPVADRIPDPAGWRSWWASRSLRRSGSPPSWYRCSAACRWRRCRRTS
jgi:ComEC/Rec2-related protein